MSNTREPSKHRWSGLTFRSVLLGISMAVVISIAEPYSQLILKSSLLTSDYLPLGAVFLFFVVVAGVNVLIKALHRTWALTPPELAVVFGMGGHATRASPFVGCCLALTMRLPAC